jgi:hypothetical protein
MRPRTHPQVYRWSGQSQFIEEDLAHLGVVMLAGVDDFLLDQRWNALPVMVGNGAAYYRCLDKLWPSTDHR